MSWDVTVLFSDGSPIPLPCPIHASALSVVTTWSLVSQAITAFCDFSGTGPKMRQNLIRVAKENGSKLGFLS